MDIKKTLFENFKTYTSYNTKSDENSETTPSTKGQIVLANYIKEQCDKIGLSDAHVDEYGYMYATLNKNTDKNIPTIGFIAHLDTSPDASGENVTLNIVENYDGSDIILKNDVIISTKEFPKLNNYIGETIITADGTTLLGADDKAGISEIMTLMEYLINHPEIPHGDIKIAFTPDEEIGKGADYFNVEKFGADFAYTLDGGKLGELQYENFNAASAKITVKGKSVHPGSAKNIMVNASLIASEIIERFPKNETPATTENYEGFFHLAHMEGSVSSSTLSYIIRDFDKENFKKRKSFIENLIKEFNEKYDNRISLEIKDQYYNMIEKVEPFMHIVDIAKKAMENTGVTPLIIPIRGGTDGARLSFMGLPCPNIFAGGHNFHGPYEYIPLSSMEKAFNVLLEIVKISSSY